MQVCISLHQQEISGMAKEKSSPMRKQAMLKSKVHHLLKSFFGQVIVKLKSKHVGGAFSKKNKCKHIPTFQFTFLNYLSAIWYSVTSKYTLLTPGVVYGVCDESAAWPYKKEREISEEVYFGLKTAQGLLEFKCKSKIHKQRWVDGIQNLLRQVSSLEATELSLESLCISNSM